VPALTWDEPSRRFTLDSSCFQTEAFPYQVESMLIPSKPKFWTKSQISTKTLRYLSYGDLQDDAEPCSGRKMPKHWFSWDPPAEKQKTGSFWQKTKRSAGPTGRNPESKSGRTSSLDWIASGPGVHIKNRRLD
jgi:hypothetical protein